VLVDISTASRILGHQDITIVYKESQTRPVFIIAWKAKYLKTAVFEANPITDSEFIAVHALGSPRIRDMRINPFNIHHVKGNAPQLLVVRISDEKTGPFDLDNFGWDESVTAGFKIADLVTLSDQPLDSFYSCRIVQLL
jgi:hypothetical protein